MKNTPAKKQEPRVEFLILKNRNRSQVIWTKSPKVILRMGDRRVETQILQLYGAMRCVTFTDYPVRLYKCSPAIFDTITTLFKYGVEMEIDCIKLGDMQAGDSERFRIKEIHYNIYSLIGKKCKDITARLLSLIIK